MAVQSAKKLTVYKKSYALAMRIFELSKRFPVEERYALTDQVRRSSRSVCNNLREAWAKRRYPPTSSASLPTAMARITRLTPLSISHATAAISLMRNIAKSPVTSRRSAR